MCAYVLMKVLESSERRYDLGMEILTLGNEVKAKIEIASRIAPGERVLDLGVGTGTLAIYCADRGAEVLGIDVSPAMIQLAEEKVSRSGLEGRVRLKGMSVVEMDDLPEVSFDTVVATFLFSELSEDEQLYALTEVHRVLKPCGRIIILDESIPSTLTERSIQLLVRIPLLVLTLLVAQTKTTPLGGIDERLSEAGFQMETETSYFLGSLRLVIGCKEAGR